VGEQGLYGGKGRAILQEEQIEGTLATLEFPASFQALTVLSPTSVDVGPVINKDVHAYFLKYVIAITSELFSQESFQCTQYSALHLVEDNN